MYHPTVKTFILRNDIWKTCQHPPPTPAPPPLSNWHVSTRTPASGEFLSSIKEKKKKKSNFLEGEVQAFWEIDGQKGERERLSENKVRDTEKD